MQFLLCFILLLGFIFSPVVSAMFFIIYFPFILGAGCLPALCRECQQDVFCHHRPVKDQQHVLLQPCFLPAPVPKSTSGQKGNWTPHSLCPLLFKCRSFFYILFLHGNIPNTKIINLKLTLNCKNINKTHKCCYRNSVKVKQTCKYAAQPHSLNIKYKITSIEILLQQCHFVLAQKDSVHHPVILLSVY